MPQIFISHSSANSAEAIALRDWLAEQGWRDEIFLDLDPLRGIAAGERWERKLHSAAGVCEVVLFLISRAWLASDWCIKELNLAHKLNKRMFGVLIEDIPYGEVDAKISGEWQVLRLAAGRDHMQFAVTLPITHDQAYVSFSREGLERLKLGLLNAGLDAKYFAWPPKHDPDRAPFRGLKPLDVDDAGIFFGRDGPTVEVLDRLRGLRETPPPRMLVILGASGAGKSSFMRAGILPRLNRDRRYFRTLPVIRPERAVITGESGLLAALETGLKAAGQQATRSNLREAVATGAGAVRELLRSICPVPTTDIGHVGEARARPPTLIIPIDQGEELFLADGADESLTFLSLISGLLEVEPPAIIALVTIRSDSYEAFQTAAALERIPQNSYSLPPLPKGSYREVITGPARRLADTDQPLKIEEPLVEALLTDIEIGGAKDALPLLAFTLERLYREHGGDGDMRLTEYESLGRVKGSIEAAVEDALKSVDTDPAIPRDRQARLALLKCGLIPWLAGIDPDTGRPRRRVARRSEIPLEARPLIDLLVERRLLSTDVNTDGEVTVEPAHEALLRQWGLLEGWLDEDFEDLATAEGIKRAARDWEANNRDAEWLSHAGGRLDAAERVSTREDLIKLFDAGELAYLASARHAEELRRQEEAKRQRRELETARRGMRRAFIGLAAALVLAVVAGIFGWQAMIQSEHASRQTEVARAETNKARQASALADQRAMETDQLRKQTQRTESGLLANATGQLTGDEHGGDTVTAMLLALEGLPDKRSEDAQQRDRPYVAKAEFQVDRALRISRERTLLAGHTEPLTVVTWKPDGTGLLTASVDKTARVWDAETGNELAVLSGHSGPVSSATWSPDGARIVTASEDMTARIWEATTGKELARLEGHAGPITGTTWSPDGKRIATASTDKTARVWEAATGKELARIEGHNGSVTSATWSPDGARIITASEDMTVRIWEASTGKELALFGGHALGWFMKRSYAAWSPDGKRILTVLQEFSAEVRDSATGKTLSAFTFPPHFGYITSTTWSPDGKQIVSVFNKSHARVWDPETGKEVASFKTDDIWLLPHQNSPWSSDGTWILTSSVGSVHVWQSSTGKELATLGHVALTAAWSPDSKTIVTAGIDGTARVWEVEPRNELMKITTADWSTAVWSPDGSQILTTPHLGTNAAIVWEALTGREVARLEPGDAYFRASFSPDGNRVLTSGKTVKVWEIATGKQLVELKGLEGWFSPDGKRIVTKSEEKVLQVWDAATGRELVKLDDICPTGKKPETSACESTGVSWTRTGERLLVLSHKSYQDSVLRIIDEIAYQTQITITVPCPKPKGALNCRIKSATWSPDGKRILAYWDVLNSSFARVWEATTGRELITLSGHEKEITSAEWSPDGARIVTSSNDNTARVWDATTGKELVKFTGHGISVFTLAGHGVEKASWSPNGERIVTGGWDNTARVWDAATGEEQALLLGHESEVSDVSWSPDGTRILSESQDDTSRIWRISQSTDLLVQAAKSYAQRCLTQEQRRTYFLPSAPPLWCIERRLWPYRGDEWQSWLAKRKAWLASGREGIEPQLPKE